MEANHLTVDDLEGPRYMRLRHLQQILDSGALAANLHWLDGVSA